MPRNPMTEDGRNRRTIDPDTYQEALQAFLTALGIEDDTAFEVIAGPAKTVVRHAEYTQQDNGVLAGDFWEDVIERGT